MIDGKNKGHKRSPALEKPKHPSAPISLPMIASQTFYVLMFAVCIHIGPLYGAGFYRCPPIVLPPADRIVSVNNTTDLNKAISTMAAGDRIVLNDGNYNGIDIENKNVGTSARPVVFTAANPLRAVVIGSTAGRNLRMSNCSYIQIYSIHFTAGSTWGVTIGGAWSGDTLTKGNEHIRLQGCEIDSAKQELLMIASNSSFIEVLGNELHHSGLDQGGLSYAEGIYLGCGAINTGVTLSGVTEDITGISRPQGSTYDFGAYEYVPATEVIDNADLSALRQSRRSFPNTFLSIARTDVVSSVRIFNLMGRGISPGNFSAYRTPGVYIKYRAALKDQK